MLGQAGQSIGILEFWRFDARRGELRLDEAEPDGWFLLIVGEKLDLRGRCCCDGLNIVRMRHVLQKKERRGSPGNGRGIPRRNKEYGSHCENSTIGTNVHWEKTNKKWGAALTVSVPILLFCYRSQNETYVKKTLKRKRSVVALEMYTADWHKHGMWAKKRVSKLYSEQYKRYNLSWGHNCGRADSRQQLGQHWFITEYIAAYIQGLYTVYKGAKVQGAVANWYDC